MAYKNTVLFIIAIVLFVYGAFISIIPAIKTATFNIDEFEKKIYDTTNLNVSIEGLTYKMSPAFKTTMKIRGINVSYIDDQPLFKANSIEITATPAILFDTVFDIKYMYVKNAVFRDQILPEGINKLEFLPGALNTKVFGKNSVTLIPGPIRVRNYKIEHITPKRYEARSIRDYEYTADEVKEFLNQYIFSTIKVK